MNIIVLTTESEVKEAIQIANQQPFTVVDIETTGLDSFKDEIIDFQFSGAGEEDVYIAPATFIHCLKVLTSRVVGHNLRFDIQFLFRNGVDVTHWQYHDTLLIGHLLDENRESNSLDSYVKEYWNDNYKEEFWKTYKTYEEAPTPAAQEYGAKDIYYTGRLYRKFKVRANEQNIPNSLITHVHRLQYSLLRTEIEGIKVDLEYITTLGVGLKGRIEQLKPEMRSLVADEITLVELEKWSEEIEKRKTDKGKAKVQRPEFSFDSRKQLQELLYNHLEIPEQYNEKTKRVSVDDASLEKIRESHPIISQIQEYRGLQKVYGTYIEGTLEKVRNERIYPGFNVSGTKTGRISHNNPNLGQLPKSGGVRGIYVPNDGCVFISADYSQLEVCLEANLTGDENLARIFQEGLSKHDITATELGISRDQAKTLNFALQYWASHFKVAKLLSVSEKEAYEIWNNYWKIYSGPKKLKARTDGMVNRGEDIVTVFGRKRRFERRKRQPWDSDYRQAYNFLIQSTGADITSRAFYDIADYLQLSGYGRALFSVHDEILIECRKEEVEVCEQSLLQCMENVGSEIDLKIPLKAESSGPMERWED